MYVYTCTYTGVLLFSFSVLPEIVTQPMDANVFIGEDATFTCIADGEPTPSIQWLFEGRVISNNNNLVIVNVQEADGGEYICIAENVHGTASAIAVLTPLCKCRDVSVSHSQLFSLSHFSPSLSLSPSPSPSLSPSLPLLLLHVHMCPLQLSQL